MADSGLIPAATLLLVRDGAPGLEVFMVKRHHQIDFASGALVFPGGKVAPGDADPALRDLADGAGGLDDAALALAAAAIREAFEESGLLLARAAGGFVAGETLAALQPFRPRLDKGELGLAAFLRQTGLRLAVDALAPFAHWITPVFMPKRFDTHFFIAAAPEGQLGRHDGGETVDSLWTGPHAAIAEEARWTVIFPTRMNLLKLAQSPTVAAALAAARAARPVTVLPEIRETADGRKVLTLPPEAGYGPVEEPLERLADVARPRRG